MLKRVKKKISDFWVMPRYCPKGRGEREEGRSGVCVLCAKKRGRGFLFGCPPLPVLCCVVFGKSEAPYKPEL